MQQIKDLERINLAELEAGVPLDSSWHAQYKGSNYVYVGGLPYNLTEVRCDPCVLANATLIVAPVHRATWK